MSFFLTLFIFYIGILITKVEIKGIIFKITFIIIYFMLALTINKKFTPLFNERWFGEKNGRE